MKIQQYWGDITMDVPLQNYWGDMSPCPIAIDAPGWGVYRFSFSVPYACHTKMTI